MGFSIVIAQKTSVHYCCKFELEPSLANLEYGLIDYMTFRSLCAKSFRVIFITGVSFAIAFVASGPMFIEVGAIGLDPALVKSTTSQSVIKTDNPGIVRAAIRSAGLREVRTTPLPNGKTFITVDTPPSSATAKMLQLELSPLGVELLPNYQYQPTITPDDPLFGDQWNLLQIDAPQAWDTTTGVSDNTVAIIDTGVLFSQSWLGSPDCPTDTPCTQLDLPESRKWVNTGEQGATSQEGDTPNCTSQGLTLDKSCNNLDDDSNGFIDDWQGWDFMGGWRGSSVVCPNNASPSTYQNPTYPNYIDYDNDPQPYSCDSPTHQSELNRNHYDGTCVAFESACYVSHGTAVASVAASSSNNNRLVAGLDWNAKIMPLRALDGYGAGSSTQIAAAVEYATAMGADIINLSLAVFSGGSCTVTDSILEDALVNAVSSGVTVVAASGNTGTSGVCYPARSNNAVAVGATNSSDTRASFSSYGPELDVVAPGASIPVALAPNKSSGYAEYSLGANGTSFAAPHAAGVASLLLGVNPSLTPSQVKSSLKLNANKVGAMNGATRTDEYGYGRINARYTVLEAQNLPYEPMEYPRSMYLNVDSQKTDTLSLNDVGFMFSEGRIISFSKKIFLNGVWYLRTDYDVARNNHQAIALSKLNELPVFEPLSQPRSFVIRSDLYKTNLLTNSDTNVLLTKGRVIDFSTKVFRDGQWYLRTEYDTNHNNYFAVPYSQLREVPTYVTMSQPRDLALKNPSTQKIDLLTLDPTGPSYPSGKVIRFQSKTTIDNVLYLRTEYDTNRQSHLGIPYSDLDEL